MSRPTAIVCTTIFEPEFLAGYLGSISQHGHKDFVTIYVIVDKKTPASVGEACEKARKEGFHVVCPTLDEQVDHISRWGLADDYIPWNTDNRRNIGYLLALEAGCEALISIDDDNFTATDSDFVGLHQVVGSEVAADRVNSSDEWFNICRLMDANVPGEIYARGFPYYAQKAREVSVETAEAPITIGMNAGLWLDEPDVDAVYRLCQRPKITAANTDQLILDANTWSPVNTQNTGLTREAALTYYYVKMGFPLRGLSIDRFGDILSGYLTQKCIKHVGQGVRLGTPVVDHVRSPHNFFKDLYHELAGIVLIEEFLPWLIEAKLEGTTPFEAYASLADQMTEAADSFNGFIWDDGGREFLKETSDNMRVWIELVQRIAL